MDQAARTGGGLTVIDAATYSGIGRSTLYRLIRDGQIGIVKVGRRTIVPRLELDLYLSRHISRAGETDSGKPEQRNFSARASVSAAPERRQDQG